MPSSAAERSVRIAMAILVFFSYYALTATYQFHTAILIVPIVALLLMPFGEMLDRRTRFYQRVTTPITLVFGAALFVAVPRINLIDAVTLLVIYVQVFTLLHDKRPRNYNHLLLMSFFLLLIGCHLSPSPSIAISLFVFVVCGAWMLTSLEIYASEFAGGEAVALDAGLVGFARKGHDAGEGGGASGLFDARTVALVAGCALGVLLLASALFFVTPRMEAGLFGASESTAFTTGISSEVDLSAGGIIEQDATAVMHVTFPDSPNGQYSGELFWRITSLDTYTGSGWIRGRLTTSREGFRASEKYRRFASSEVFDNGPGVDRRLFGGGKAVRQIIFLANAPESGVPALPVPKAVAPTEGRRRVQFKWDRGGDYTVVASKTRETGISYDVISEVFDYSPEELRKSEENYRAIVTQGDLRALTYQNLRDDTKALVERIVGDSATAYDKVALIEAFFRGNGFVYSLNIPELPEDHPIDAFIQRSKTGHCELYASAMALMVRSQGVPARVVSGYRGGEWNENDRSYTVRADMAHLWVEVYFPDFGWVAFDPSPSLVDENLTGIGSISRMWSRLALRGKMMWYRNVVGFSPEMRLSFMKDSGLRLVRYGLNIPADDTGERFFGGLSLTRLLVAPAVQVCALAFAGLMLFRAYRRRPRVDATLSADQARAVRLYAALIERLRECGIDARGKTIEELRAEAAELAVEERDRLVDALSACNAARFGGRPFPEPAFKRVYREIRQLPFTAILGPVQ